MLLPSNWGGGAREREKSHQIMELGVGKVQGDHIQQRLPRGW